MNNTSKLTSPLKKTKITHDSNNIIEKSTFSSSSSFINNIHDTFTKSPAYLRSALFGSITLNDDVALPIVESVLPVPGIEETKSFSVLSLLNNGNNEKTKNEFYQKYNELIHKIIYHHCHNKYT